MPDSEILAASFKLSDAQEMVARQQGFDGWQALKTGLSTTPLKVKSLPSKATTVQCRAATVRHRYQEIMRIFP
jgi:hypothetical protein